MSQYDLESQWLTAEGIGGVNIRYGDVVRVKKPDYRDQLFVVISLMALTPTPTFGVTRSTDEHFLIVSQEELVPTGVNSGRKLTLHR